MPPRRRKPVPANRTTHAAGAVRIIGGRFRGRRLAYSGDPRTRPMKDRVREAIFNLVGPAVKHRHALDLFAGTGALGLEALSRGAARATFLEKHFPTADLIRRSIADLEIGDACQVVAADTFIWWRRKPDLGSTPLVSFCSPPYDFYTDRSEDMMELMTGLLGTAPAGSLLVVEADNRFDLGSLPRHETADIRAYPPAVVGLFETPGTNGS